MSLKNDWHIKMANYQSQQVIRALCTYMDFILSTTMEFDPKLGTAVKLNRKGLWSGVEWSGGEVGWVGRLLLKQGRTVPQMKVTYTTVTKGQHQQTLKAQHARIVYDLMLRLQLILPSRC